MNENYNFNKTPLTNKPSATRYNTIVLFCILIIILVAYMHIIKNGLHLEIKIPYEIRIPTEIKLPPEVLNNVKEVKATLANTTKSIESPVNMEYVYYCSKIVLITGLVLVTTYYGWTFITAPVK